MLISEQCKHLYKVQKVSEIIFLSFHPVFQWTTCFSFFLFSPLVFFILFNSQRINRSIDPSSSCHSHWFSSSFGYRNQISFRDPKWVMNHSLLSLPLLSLQLLSSHFVYAMNYTLSVSFSSNFVPIPSPSPSLNPLSYFSHPLILHRQPCHLLPFPLHY